MRSDKVITGFGHAGAMFGADAFGVVPDNLNVAKQVTNGAIPLGAVIVKEEIYQTFMAAGGPEYLSSYRMATRIPRIPWPVQRRSRHSIFCKASKSCRAWRNWRRISRTPCIV